MQAQRFYLCTLRVTYNNILSNYPLCIDYKNNRYYLDDPIYHCSCFFDGLNINNQRIINWYNEIHSIYIKHLNVDNNIRYCIQLKKLISIFSEELNNSRVTIPKLDKFIKLLENEIITLI